MGGAALLAVSALLSMLYLFGRPAKRGRPGVDWPRIIVKAGSVALLAVYAAVFGGPWSLVLALAFGALGDAFLVQDGDLGFIGGLASFLIAHLFYAVLFWPPDHFLALAANPLQIVATLLLLFWAIMLLRIVWTGAKGLHLPVILYAAAILAMMVSAISTERPGIVIGALLFFASDSVLALEKFGLDRQSPARRLTAPFVWASYYLAQAVIMLSWLSGT